MMPANEKGRGEAARIAQQVTQHANRTAPCVDDQPEHRGDRRRFLVWALMLGATKPEIVTARIVADVLAQERGADDA